MRKPVSGARSKRTSPKEKTRHLPRLHQRISARLDFEQLFRCGKRWSGQYVNIWIHRPESSSSSPARFAVMVGRKAEPGAVKRNRWKRRIRVIFSRHGADIESGTRVLFQVRKCVAEPAFSDLDREIVQLFNQAGIIDDRGK